MSLRNAIGIIELASVYKGYEVLDAVLKSANVEKMVARTICSGKYFIVLRGDVADVEAAIEIAREVGGFSVVNLAAIPNIDDQVFPALSGTCAIKQGNYDGNIGAVLIIETFSVVSAIKAADHAAKTADIDILRVHVAMAIGGKGVAVITGDVASLEVAAEAAIENIKEDGMLAGYTIISNPHKEVLKDLI